MSRSERLQRAGWPLCHSGGPLANTCRSATASHAGPGGNLPQAKERAPERFVLDLKQQCLDSNYKHLGRTCSLRRERKEIGQLESSRMSMEVGVTFPGVSAPTAEHLGRHLGLEP